MNHEETVRQLGGFGKCKAMVGASFSKGENKLYMRFKGSRKLNSAVITLNSMDTYDIEFSKATVKGLQNVQNVNGVYCDMLKETFEKTTGLYLSF